MRRVFGLGFRVWGALGFRDLATRLGLWDLAIGFEVFGDWVWGLWWLDLWDLAINHNFSATCALPSAFGHILAFALPPCPRNETKRGGQLPVAVVLSQNP